MADEQDQAETLDEDKISEFPPEKPPGAQAYGAAGTDPLVGESVAQRAGREEPEEVPLDPLPTVGDPDDPVLAEDDAVAGDATTRDVAREKAVVTPAEEAALHVVDADAPGFDSTVDEPALADAHELDPEVDR
ncbi:hypothetical protein BH20ACT3_BH20ACT3_04320 [soil metagenome]